MFFESSAAQVIMTAALILGIVFAIAYFIRSRSPLFFLSMAFTFIGFIFAIARTTCLSENLTAGQTIGATSFIVTLGIGSIVCLFLIWKRTTANVLKAMRIIRKIIELIAKTVMMIMIFVIIPIYLFPNSPLSNIFPHNIQEWVQNSHAWFISIATVIVITWKFLDLFLYEENSSNPQKTETKRTENGNSVINRHSISDYYRNHFAPKPCLIITYQDSDKSELDTLMYSLKTAGLDSHQVHRFEDFLMVEAPAKDSPAFSILANLHNKFSIEAIELNQPVVLAEMVNRSVPTTTLIDAATCPHDYDPHGCCRRCGHLKPGGLAYQEFQKDHQIREARDQLEKMIRTAEDEFTCNEKAGDVCPCSGSCDLHRQREVARYLAVHGVTVTETEE